MSSSNCENSNAELVLFFTSSKIGGVHYVTTVEL